MKEEKHIRKYRGSLFGPIILICLGLVFLLSNLNVLQGDAWSLLLQLWPVFLIAIGLDGILRREGLVGATLMLGLGVVFLLSNFGYLALNVWEMVIQLWPVLIIAVGFDILIGRRSLLASLVGVVLIVAILVGALMWFGVRVDSSQALAGEEVRQALEGATEARIVIEPGAGSIHLGTTSEKDLLMAGRIAKYKGQQVTKEFSQQGGKATFTLRERGVAFYYSIGEQDWNWNLGVSPKVSLDLKVSLGAGAVDLNLRELNVSALEVSLGVGELTVTLPASSTFRGKISGAIGQLTIVVPRGTAVRIKVSKGLGSLDISSGFKKQGDTYTTLGYETAEKRIDLEASLAIGEVIVQER